MNKGFPCAALTVSLTLASGTTHSQATETGYSAANLYNLGNSYARRGKVGMAVLNYERARLLAPNDPDIEANLRYVRAASHLPEPPQSTFDRLARRLSPLSASWIGVLGLLLVGSSVLAAQFHAGRSWMRRAALLLGILMLAVTVCNGIALWPSLHTGVVVGAQTPVRVAPVPMSDSTFVLPEAETVTVSAEHEGYLLIKTRSGHSGWVARSAVALVMVN